MNGGIGGVAFDFGSLTPEEREYILSRLPDLTGQEEMITRQQAMADALRPQTTQRMDVGSQLARALQGTYGGYLHGQAQQQRGELGKAYSGFARNYPRRRRPNEMSSSGVPVGGDQFFNTSGIDPYQYDPFMGQS